MSSESKFSSIIDGLTYIPNYITEQQQSQLISIIDSKPWTHALQRRVQQYGYIYDYSTRSLAWELCDSIPVEFRAIHSTTDNINQVIVNEYKPGQGIFPHVDHTKLFGDTIMSLSLLSAVDMNFIEVKNPSNTKKLTLEPRSLVILTGDARYKYKHGIKAIKRGRSRRVSITYREVINLV